MERVEEIAVVKAIARRHLNKAVELQEDGHPIEIISERRWIEVAGSAHDAS